MPALWLSQKSLRKAGSVPSCCVTSYWIGVSFFFSSASDGLAYLSMDAPLLLLPDAAMRTSAATMASAAVISFFGMTRPPPASEPVVAVISFAYVDEMPRRCRAVPQNGERDLHPPGASV